MHQQTTIEIAGSASRARFPVPASPTRERMKAPRVVVAWAPASDGNSASVGPTQVELEAQLESSARATWTCREPSGSGWAEALTSAGCSEVVLTSASEDQRSRHLVFELADRLTRQLAANRPLIRVRFLPPSELTTAR